MKAEEIRNQPITMHGAGLDDPQSLAVGCAGILQELAAQVAELNESRKPRWVNLSDTGEPCLVDATKVVGLSTGPNKCVYVRVRGAEAPLVIFGCDHDEVRFKLGIDEDWLQPPRYTPGRHVSEADYAEMMAIIDTARKVVQDPAMLKVYTGAGRDNLDRLNILFESFDSMPF